MKMLTPPRQLTRQTIPNYFGQHRNIGQQKKNHRSRQISNRGQIIPLLFIARAQTIAFTVDNCAGTSRVWGAGANSKFALLPFSFLY